MQQIRFANLVFTPDDGRLRREGGERETGLRPQAARLLECLVENAGEVVSRDRLVEAIWGDAAVVDFDSGLAALMRELRQAVRSVGGPTDLIETVPRRGYRLDRDAGTGKGGRAPGGGRTPQAMLAAALLLLALAAAIWRLAQDGAPPETPAPATCSLAILPFDIYDDRPGLPEHAELLLADGLLAALLRKPVARMSLVGRTSLRPYVGRDDIAAAIAGDLDVDLLIEGSVQVSGEGGRRVQARLLSMPPGRVVWSDEVNLDAGDPLQVGAVTRSLAESLAEAWPSVCRV